MSRDYAKIAPEFWVGATGSAMRDAGPIVGFVALYLISCPHARATGLYRLPLAYAATDTGLEESKISKALEVLEGIGFVERDESIDLIWVREMGRFQVGETLKGGDRRKPWAIKQLAPYKGSKLYPRFLERYAEPWGIPTDAPSKGHTMPLTMPLRRGNETGDDAPSKPRARARARTKNKETQSDSIDSEESGEQVGGLRPPTVYDHSGEASTEKPLEAPESAAEPEGIQTEPEESGAATRLLGRLSERQAESAPESGRALRMHRDTRAPEGVRAGCLFGKDRLVVPGKWSPPPEVWQIVESVSPRPRYERPAPPLLPSTDTPKELAEAMALAWGAVYARHTGRRYNGGPGKRVDSIAEAAKHLRGEGVSAWEWFQWGWLEAVERTKKPPQFFTLASPKAVANRLWIFNREGRRYNHEIFAGDRVEELSKGLQSARMELLRVRPATAEEAREIVSRNFPKGVEYSVREADAEEAEARKRDKIAIRRGVWIWKE